MARFMQAAAASGVPYTQHVDHFTDLSRLLDRLQHTILLASGEREVRLRTSEFERAKAQSNIDHARSLLTKLEQEALAIKIYARRQETQADLNRKRELIDRLAEHMNDLNEMAAAAAVAATAANVEKDSLDDKGDNDQDNTSDDDDGEDILAEIIATPSESLKSSSRSPPHAPAQAPQGDNESIPEMPEPPLQEEHEEEQQQIASEDRDEDESEEKSRPAAHTQTEPQPKPQATEAAPTIPKSPEPQLQSHSQSPSTHPAPLSPQTAEPPQATSTSQTLRPRHTAAAAKAPANQAHTTGSSALFGDRAEARPTSTSSVAQQTATTEAILDRQRAEQDALSESILKLAGALKASSHALSTSLDEDKELVDRAGDRIHRTGEGMQAVTRRMGMLQRVTEGEGWWGRMRLYAMIYGLMVVLVLLVFVMPKLRF
ncbi:synaptobrevin [Podospora appendiculata]|uniref:Synaptobrevin n=1 Tax=Podospora appendiculata TaxID=314037 RepID=A0AAE1CFB9_9PEZI|nr:synaptobrevin [Podospora appendiculata]